MSLPDKSSMKSSPSRKELDQLAAMFNAGRIAQVIEQAGRLAQRYPRCVELLITLGAANLRMNRFDKAADACSRAVKIEPNNPSALSNLGIALKELGRTDQAIKALQRAVTAKPDFTPARFNLGNALRENGNPKEAAEAYRKVLAARPNDVQAHCNLGLAQYDLEKFEDAAKSYRAALDISPDHAMSLGNLGNALSRLGKPEEALHCLRKALKLRPDQGMLYYNLGRVLVELGRLDEADTAYREAIARDANNMSAQFNLAYLDLRRGNFESGWKRHEWRKKKPDSPNTSGFRTRMWTGKEDLKGKGIFLYYEQGLGDTIQFIRYATMVRDLGAKVTVGLQPRLIPLLHGSFPELDFMSKGKLPNECEYHAALMSLPLAFDTRLDNVPAPDSYLRADPARVQRWKEHIGQDGFRIGICWQGSTLPIDKGRSFPLSCFAGIAGQPNVRLISLHKGAGESQLDTMPEGLTVETLGDDFDPPGAAFTDSAAVMENCDLIITSDTAVAHLAGALGRPVWLLLQEFPDWRWMIDRTDSPWYPSMRLFRQTKKGDWQGVFETVEAALAELLETRRTRIAAEQ